MSLKKKNTISFILSILFCHLVNAQISTLNNSVLFQDTFSDSIPEVIFFLPITSIEENKYYNMLKILKDELVDIDTNIIKSHSFFDNTKSKSKGLNIVIDSSRTILINELQVFFNNFDSIDVKRAVNKFNENYFMNDIESYAEYNLFNIDIVDTSVCFMGIEYKIPEYAKLINEILNPVYSQDELNDFLESDIIILQESLSVLKAQIKDMEKRINRLELYTRDLERKIEREYRKKVFRFSRNDNK